jgi:DNA polymerase
MMSVETVDALRTYLAWQAEIGLDEVILSAPLVLRASTPAMASAAGAGQKSSSKPASRTSTAPSGYATAAPTFAQAAPGGQGVEPGGLYEMLSKSLEESESNAKGSRALGRPAVAPSPEKPAGPGLPVFADMAELRGQTDREWETLLKSKGLGTVRLVHGSGPEFAPLALAGLEPGPEDLESGAPFQGESGDLLARMMKAIRLDMPSLYATYVVKAGAPGRSLWTRRDLVRLLPLFHAELALAKAPVVLLLGEACAQAVLKTGRPLDELRQAAHAVPGAPGRDFVATYHPEDLLRKEELKRKAWDDLKWLQPRLRGT